MSWQLPINKYKTTEPFNPSVYGVKGMEPYNFSDAGEITRVPNRKMKIIAQNALQASPAYVARSDVGFLPSKSFNNQTKKNYSI